MSGRDHREAHRCTRCGQRCSAKRLTDLGEAGVVCTRCLDRIPHGERRTLLRRAGKEAFDAVS